MPLTFADPATYDAIGEDDRINVLDLPPVPGPSRALPDRQARRHDRSTSSAATRSATSRSSGSRPARRSTSCAGRWRRASSRSIPVERSTTRWISSPPCAPPARHARFTDEPVDRDTVAAILDDARFAPSGGNRQPWRVAVVEDRALRRQLAALMQPVWDEYVAAAATGQTPFNTVDVRAARSRSPPDSRTSCSTASSDVPVVLAVAADLATDRVDGRTARPPTDHRRRVGLPVLLERPARRTRRAGSAA